jgi:hypothetical protein
MRSITGMIIYGTMRVSGKEPVLESLCLSQMSSGTGYYNDSGRLTVRTTVITREGEIPIRHSLSPCPSR